MSELTDQEYDELAARLTDPATPLSAPTQAQTGEAARVAGQEFMLREYGSPEAIAEALVRRSGRPRIGHRASGESPTVRARISDVDYAAFKKLEDLTGKTQSELVRQAVHQFLEQHKMVG